jgi:hypothetical protein
MWMLLNYSRQTNIKGGGGSWFTPTAYIFKKGGCGEKTASLPLCIVYFVYNNSLLTNVLNRIMITRTRYNGVRVSLFQEVVKCLNRLKPGQKKSCITKKYTPKIYYGTDLEFL